MDTEIKQKLIKKFSLVNENGMWYSIKENSHKQPIIKEAFFEKTDIIGVLFRINKLCMAKLKYFRNNINKFQFYKYHYKNGFTKTELWDAEFFKHKNSGYIIDIRFLQSITLIDDFTKLCEELNEFDKNIYI